MRSPVKWLGGKQRQAQNFLPLLPPHRNWVEVFGGSAALTFAKEPAVFEVYNDLHGGLVNFFDVLRNHGGELQRRLTLTPYAYADARLCQAWEEQEDPIEQARMFFVAVRSGFSGVLTRGFFWRATAEKNDAAGFANVVDELDMFARRLRRVHIDGRSWEKVIPTYDSDDTLFYLDPPYVRSTRVDGDYTHEMADDDHMGLLTMARGVKGMVALSGYDSDLYRDMLTDWDIHTFDTVCHTEACEAGDTRSTRTECLWLNPQATARKTKPRQIELFESVA